MEPSIQPQVLGLELSYRCPLRCRHCCVEATATESGALTVEEIVSLIRQASRVRTIQEIGITGGEPFLRLDLVRVALEEAHARGLAAHIVTSAYWASSLQKATAVLSGMSDGALTELYISYDDAHAEFVHLERILFAYRASMRLSLRVLFQLSCEANCVITGKWLQSRLAETPEYDASRTRIQMGPVVTTGRARGCDDEVFAARLQSPYRYAGPCALVFRRIAVTPQGWILPCCGPVSARAELAIGNIHTDSLADSLRRLYRDPLLKWIAFEGPVSVLETLRREDGDSTPLQCDSICHACEILFGSSALVEQARRYVASAGSQQIQELVYRGLGHFPSCEDVVQASDNGSVR